MNNIRPFTTSRRHWRSLSVRSIAVLLAASAFGANEPQAKLAGQANYRVAALDPHEPELSIVYPGAAATRGIVEGEAVVSVAINARGEATDFLITSHTDKAFGLALLDHVKPLKFQAARFAGTAVPGRTDIGYRFINRSGGLGLTTFDAARRQSEGNKEAKISYTAVLEKELDLPLEFTDLALPKLPAGYPEPTDNKPVKVFVTFYIDEEGKVRLPNVESAAAPELIPGAIKAVGMWTFKPAMVKGKPALVYAGRPVSFLPRNPPAEAPAPAR
jgi:hypothetical protein